FFQAEDGIRDFHVTGVQTCALPILPHSGFEQGIGEGLFTGSCFIHGAKYQNVAAESCCNRTNGIENRAILPRRFSAASIPTYFRSEERRVGKECRTRSCACV